MTRTTIGYSSVRHQLIFNNNFDSTVYSDEDENEEKNEEPEEWGKFLHLKERVRIRSRCFKLH